MGSQGPKSTSLFCLLFVNIVLYTMVVVIAGWSINYAVDETARKATELSAPARLFPIYYPIGNLASGFLVIFALVAGVVGVITSLSCIQSLANGSTGSLASAAASSTITWALVLLSMGVACKEISIGWREPSLRTLETLTIILSGTQLLCAATLNASLLSSPAPYPTAYGGRV